MKNTEKMNVDAVVSNITYNYNIVNLANKQLKFSDIQQVNNTFRIKHENAFMTVNDFLNNIEETSDKFLDYVELEGYATVVFFKDNGGEVESKSVLFHFSSDDDRLKELEVVEKGISLSDEELSLAYDVVSNALLDKSNMLKSAYASEVIESTLKAHYG